MSHFVQIQLDLHILNSQMASLLFSPIPLVVKSSVYICAESEKTSDRLCYVTVTGRRKGFLLPCGLALKWNLMLLKIRNYLTVLLAQYLKYISCFLHKKLSTPDWLFVCFMLLLWRWPEMLCCVYHLSEQCYLWEQEWQHLFLSNAL